MSEETPLPRISYAGWVINSLGWPTIHLLFLVTVFALVLISWLHRRGRGPTVAPAIMLLIPLPCFIGCLISLGSVIDWLSLIAVGSSQPSASIYSELLSRALLAFTVSAGCSLPLLVAGVALLCRSETSAAEFGGNGAANG